MKPLPVAPLTEGDLNVWVSIGHLVYPSRKHWGDVLAEIACDADRRDAELMYRIEVCRQYERDHPAEFEEYRGLGWVHSMVGSVIEGGAVRFVDSDITYFA